MNAKQLIEILRYLPPNIPVRVTGDDGVEEFEFGRPVVQRFNKGTAGEFAAITIVVPA